MPAGGGSARGLPGGLGQCPEGLKGEAMARAAADRRPPAGTSRPEDRAEVLRQIMADLRLAALTFVAQARVEDTARHWLADARMAAEEEDEDVAAFVLGEALALALDVGRSAGPLPSGRSSPGSTLRRPVPDARERRLSGSPRK